MIRVFSKFAHALFSSGKLKSYIPRPGFAVFILGTRRAETWLHTHFKSLRLGAIFVVNQRGVGRHFYKYRNLCIGITPAGKFIKAQLSRIYGLPCATWVPRIILLRCCILGGLSSVFQAQAPFHCDPICALSFLSSSLVPASDPDSPLSPCNRLASGQKPPLSPPCSPSSGRRGHPILISGEKGSRFIGPL